jgi:hypothetical protein
MLPARDRATPKPGPEGLADRISGHGVVVWHGVADMNVLAFGPLTTTGDNADLTGRHRVTARAVGQTAVTRNADGLVKGFAWSR